MKRNERELDLNDEMPLPMTEERWRAFWAERKKWGRTTIPISALWFAGLLDHAIRRGDIETLMNSSIKILEKFRDRDSSFFTEIAKWLKLDGSVLNARQRWLQERLFRDQRHDEQSDFLTMSELMREIAKTRFRNWDERRVRTDMDVIGARLKNSPKAEKLVKKRKGGQ